MDLRDYNRITPVKYPRKRRKCTIPAGSIADIVHHAEAEGKSYGEYVAATERYEYSPVLGKSNPDFGRPSSWVHQNRTLLEGLNKELHHPDARAEYLNDPEAKRQLLIAEANERERRELIRKSRDAECRVQSWCRSTEEIIRKRGYNSVR